MTRPSAPTFPVPTVRVRTWATNGSYPAGPEPWAGNPNKVEHPDPEGGFVPGQAACAPHVNKLYNEMFSQDQEAVDALTAIRGEAQAHADGVLAYLGQLPAQNFLARSTDVLGSETNAPVRVIGWSEADRMLWAVGDESNVQRSVCAGHIWQQVGVAGDSATENCRYLEIDPAGNWVAGTDAGSVFEFNHGTGVVTAHDIPSAFATGEVCPAYDPASGKWAVACYASEGGIQVATSMNRADWTLRAVPSPWSVVGDLRDPVLCSNGASRIIAVAQLDAATGFRTMTSDDGGVTWTDRGTTAAAGAIGSSRTRLQWVAAESKFVAMFANNLATEIWKSPDGVTWTKTGDAASVLMNIACIGALYVGVTTGNAISGGHVVYSTDYGATWKQANWSVDNVITGETPIGVFYAGGRTFVATDYGVWLGMATGDGGAPLL